MTDPTRARLSEWRRVWSRAANLSRDDLDELEQHLLDSIRVQVESGVPEARAVEIAIRGLGDAELVAREFEKVETSGLGGAGWSLDLRFALRQAWTHRGFTAMASLSVGGAIALNAIAFSVIDAVLLEDPAYQDPEAVVEIYTAGTGDLRRPPVASWPMADDLRNETSIFEGVIGYEPLFGRLRVAGGAYEGVFGEVVDPSYFDVLGVPLELGRGFTEEDARRAEAVAVLGWSTWRQRLQGRADVLGSTIDVNGEVFTVIGVAPREFTGAIPGLSSGLFLPRWSLPLGRALPEATTRPDQDRTRWQVQLKGRLRPGVRMIDARDYLTSRLEAWTERHPESYEGVEFSLVRSDRVALSPAADRILFPFAGGVMLVLLCVLLVACVNLAGFLLSRGSDRARELQMRRALGATRQRLVRQLFQESMLIAGLSAGVGLILCRVGVAGLGAIDVPLPLPIHLDVSMGGAVIAFTVVVATAASLAFGLVPALYTTRNLGSLARGGGAGSDGRHFRSAVLATQVATSIVLLVVGGLLTRSLLAEATVELGFRGERAGIVTLELASAGMSREALPGLLDGIRSEATVGTGIDAVFFTSRVPLGTFSSNVSLEVPGGEAWTVEDFAVSHDYFDGMGIEFVSGSGFPRGDLSEDVRVAVVSRSLAELLRGSDVKPGATVLIDGVETEIVGVVEDVKVSRPREGTTPHLYRPVRQTGAFLLAVVGTSRGPSPDAVRALRRAVREAGPDVVVWGEGTIEDHVALKMLGPRVAVWLLGGAAAVALLMTLVGVFGAVRYSSARRSREMAIRLSLGASAGSVIGALVLALLRSVGVGMVVGLGAALLLGRGLRSVLVGTSPLDATSYAAAVALLVGTTLLASYLPARRATRVELRSLLDDS